MSIKGATVMLFVLGAGLSVSADMVYMYSESFNLSIPSNSDSKGWMDEAIIEIRYPHIISDLDIGLCITHTNVFDLQIFIESPAGTRVCLNMYNPFDEFFEGADYTYTVFDDEAIVPIKEGAAPFRNRFRPMDGSSLSVFNGENTQGMWRLKIYDAFYYDTGTLDRFTVMFRNPEPATAAMLLIGAGLMRLLNRKGRGYSGLLNS